jgi:hypothetical protein
MEEARKAAASEGVSLNQLINVAGVCDVEGEDCMRAWFLAQY